MWARGLASVGSIVTAAPGGRRRGSAAARAARCGLPRHDPTGYPRRRAHRRSAPERRGRGQGVRDTDGMEQVRLSEVMGGLSYALDLTEGEPPGHAARTCLIGMRLAKELGLSSRARSDLFYALLLKDAGCSANSARMAALFAADDHRAKWSSKRVDWARPLAAFAWAARTVRPGGSPAAKVRQLLVVKDEREVTRSLMAARCQRGAQIARRLGLSTATAAAIYALDEHYDGGGYPHGLAGADIPLGARIAC